MVIFTGPADHKLLHMSYRPLGSVTGIEVGAVPWGRPLVEGGCQYLVSTRKHIYLTRGKLRCTTCTYKGCLLKSSRLTSTVFYS